MHLLTRHINDDAAQPPPPSSAGGFQITRLLPREEASSSCHPHPNMNLCEKPTISSSSLFIALLIVSIVLLICFFCFLWFLHRRRSRMDKLEDFKNTQELDDYGIAPQSFGPTSQRSNMPKVPPPIAQTRENSAAGGKIHSSINNNRVSQDSLTPSLRQALGRAQQDPFSNR